MARPGQPGAGQRYGEAQRLRRQGQRQRNRARKHERPEVTALAGADYEIHLRHWLSAAELLPKGPREEVHRYPEGAGEAIFGAELGGAVADEENARGHARIVHENKKARDL